MTIRFASRGAIALAATLVFAPSTVRAQDGPIYGPSKGTLLIVGGGSLRDSGITEKFIELAGGKDAKIVVVPTAGGNRNQDGSLKVYAADEALRSWRARGLTQVVLLHTADPKVANTPEFVKPLTEAKAVWFEGGRQWNLVDSYANTLAEQEFHRVLERGGVIGGSSAGATIQGDFLVRGAVENNTLIVAPEPEHHKGFGFLRKSAIDQHINTRNRWDDIVPLIKDRSDLLGIGLSENTAIVVKGDTFEVIGAWKVAVHDNTRVYQPWEKPYYVLSAGDVYNMKTRRIEKVGTGAAPAAPSRNAAQPPARTASTGPATASPVEAR